MFIVQTAVAFVAFMAIDLLWLGVLAKDFYKKHLGDMMAKKPIWLAAVTFYILFLIGLVYFAINPADTWTDAVRDGALFGFMTYMTYELTNYAVIAHWPRALVLPDILWGTALSTMVSVITFLVTN